MIAVDKDGVAIRCDKCGSRLIIAANEMQPAARRLPSGWMRADDESHTCPLCSRSVMSAFRHR